MGWSIGYDDKWKRDIGYGVPAYCDHPDCGETIDRGLAHVCAGEEPRGGHRGCGLYFCEKHLLYSPQFGAICERCYPKVRKPFSPKPEHPEWLAFKATDPNWEEWRNEQTVIH
jgi:hypothetical protein